MGTTDFESQLRGMRLTTAEIMYRMSDFRDILQTYVWQDYDLHPLYPKLKSFLDFWVHKLEGPLQGVRVAHKGLICPREFRYKDGQLIVH